MRTDEEILQDLDKRFGCAPAKVLVSSNTKPVQQKYGYAAFQSGGNQRPSRHHEVVALKKQGMLHREIAAKLGLTEQTCKQYMTLARARGIA